MAKTVFLYTYAELIYAHAVETTVDSTEPIVQYHFCL